MNEVIQGDCLEVMRGMPDNSVDLIATDPPYFGVKGGGRTGQFEWWDRQWDKPAEFLKWLDSLAEQWQRILKPNGSLYCCASPRMAARVEVKLGERFNVLNNIRWVKEAGWHQKASKEEARQFKEPWESIIFCEHHGADSGAKDESGYWTKCDEAARDVWGNYIKQVRTEHGLTAKQLTEVVGAYGTVNHGGACSNWEKGKNCPTPDHYAKLRQAFPGYFTREYEDLKREYEDLRRPFTVSAEVPYTDVWTFPTVQSYPGKHLCEKPLAMMEHIVTASSKPGAVVLDCFAGSGNTLVAAKKHDRQFIGIEIDPHWVDVARGRVGQTQRFVSESSRTQWLQTQGVKAASTAIQQISIFDIA